MRVCVLGAGLAGLATAYHLVRQGHDVIVVDSSDDVGNGTSKSNGGQLSYSYVSPLAAPGVLWKAARWILDREAPLRVRLRADRHLLRWLLGFARACNDDAFAATTRDMLALARHSRRVLAEMLERDRLEFSYRQNGKLVVFRDHGELDAAAKVVALQERFGARQELVDASGCVDLEPALANVAGQLVGGVYTADEAVGDSLAFCIALKDWLLASGRASLRLRQPVGSLIVANGGVIAARTADDLIEADQFVLAAGIGAMHLAAKLGVDLSLYPLKGYSLTTPVRAIDRPPRVSITDASNKVVYALLEGGPGSYEGRLRTAGMVDIVGFDDAIDPSRTNLLLKQSRSAFPDAADWVRSVAWAGLRPATPDWKPIIGHSGVDRLWLSVGFGGLGFTLACGAGELLADAMSGRRPAIALGPYTRDRRSVTDKAR